MGDDIEIQFRGGNPKKWYPGKMRLEDGLVKLAALDGRTKSAQLDGHTPEGIARSSYWNEKS
jgi:hypothetical protein